jgi:hypothetical protein
MEQKKASSVSIIDKIVSFMIPIDLFAYTPTLNISGGSS